MPTSGDTARGAGHRLHNMEPARFVFLNETGLTMAFDGGSWHGERLVEAVPRTLEIV
jgi:hypothetical protein